MCSLHFCRDGRTSPATITSPIPLLTRRFLLFSLIAFSCFAFLHDSHAVTPAPDGGYPNQNTAEGQNALFDVTSGGKNTALGYSALFGDFIGSRNTAVGSSALYWNGNDNSNASDNTGVGYAALLRNKNGSQNVAVGSEALRGPDTGSSYSYNTATGFQSLYSIANGYANVATGWLALHSNRAGAHNTASGGEALYNNVADFNTATGSRALYTNSTGTGNTASGYATLYQNTSGSYNTAEGIGALSNNTTGSNNVALGHEAGLNLTTGSNNIVIGAGVLGAAVDANKIRIGKSTHTATYIGGIYNKSVSSATTGGGVPVLVDSTGKLGTMKSSARYKDHIKPMDKASEAILALEPVTFRYKQELDPDGAPQFGLIAEQVEKVNPELVIRDEDGKVSTVRYEAVNAMLLNEFLKEHRTVQEQASKIDAQNKETRGQQAEIAQLKTLVARQQKQIDALTATVQKVSDQLDLTSPRQVIASRR